MKLSVESKLWRAYRVSRKIVWQMFYLPSNWVVSHVAPHLKRRKVEQIIRKLRKQAWFIMMGVIILLKKVAPHLKLKTKGFPLPPHPLLLPKRKKVYYVYPKKKKFPLSEMEESQGISRNAWNISSNDAFPTLSQRQESSSISMRQRDGLSAKAQSKNGVVV